MNAPGDQSDEAFAAEVQELYEKLARCCVGYRAAVVLTASGFCLAAAARYSGVSVADVEAELRSQWDQLEKAGR